MGIYSSIYSLKLHKALDFAKQTFHLIGQMHISGIFNSLSSRNLPPFLPVRFCSCHFQGSFLQFSGYFLRLLPPYLYSVHFSSVIQRLIQTSYLFGILLCLTSIPTRWSFIWIPRTASRHLTYSELQKVPLPCICKYLWMVYDILML